jgi:hypothetical protein
LSAVVYGALSSRRMDVYHHLLPDFIALKKLPFKRRIGGPWMVYSIIVSMGASAYDNAGSGKVDS